MTCSKTGKKIYLAHSISTKAEFKDSIRVANEIRDLGYEVYAAAENNSINDKSNDPTPIDIYEGDISEIMKCDIFVINLSGGLQDGTISEIGFVAGLNESVNRLRLRTLKEYNVFHEVRLIQIIAYTSNARLLQPQFSAGIPSASANHLVLGMIDKWGGFVGSEKEMLNALPEVITC